MYKITFLFMSLFFARTLFAEITESPINLQDGPYGTLIISGIPGVGQSGDFQLKKCQTNAKERLYYFSCETGVEAKISLNDQGALSVDLPPGLYQLVMYGGADDQGTQKLLHGNLTYVNIVQGKNSAIELRTKKINNRRGSFEDVTVYLNPENLVNQRLVAYYVAANGFFQEPYDLLCRPAPGYDSQMTTGEYSVYRFCKTFSESEIRDRALWGYWIDDTLIPEKKGRVSLNRLRFVNGTWNSYYQSDMQNIDLWLTDLTVKPADIEKKFISVLPIPEFLLETESPSRLAVSFQHQDGIDSHTSDLEEHAVPE